MKENDIVFMRNWKVFLVFSILSIFEGIVGSLVINPKIIGVSYTPQYLLGFFSYCVCFFIIGFWYVLYKSEINEEKGIFETAWIYSELSEDKRDEFSFRINEKSDVRKLNKKGKEYFDIVIDGQNIDYDSYL